MTCLIKLELSNLSYSSCDIGTPEGAKAVFERTEQYYQRAKMEEQERMKYLIQLTSQPVIELSEK